MVLFSAGSSLTYHFAPSVLNVVFPKALFSTLRHVHYTLSTLFCSISLDHHLYAHDTRLFFSFHPLNFNSNISHLQKRSSVFLLFTQRLNSCSSDSKNNLPKYTTLYFTPPTLLEILALSLTNILPSLTKLHLSPKPVTITFVNFAVSGLTLICQLPVPLLPV